MSFIEK
jgi:hypothetical protein